MTITNLLKHFAKTEDGAVTVDWVVLTAGIVGLGMVVVATISPAIQDMAWHIGFHIWTAM